MEWIVAPSTYDVHVVRDFDAPIERVWAAWTTPSDLREWWGPEGFTCPRAEADVRVGGRILVTMRAPEEWGGIEQHSSWTIVDLEPPRLLRYVFRFTDAAGEPITPAEAGIPAGVPDAGAHEVVLSELEGGRTRLEMTEHGYADAEVRDMSQAGLEQCLDKMETLVVGRPGGSER
jgi:uncharacterized protein YndB with AHSA1/START domain